MSHKYHFQEYLQCPLPKQPLTQEDVLDCQWLAQAIAHYHQVEHLQDQATLHRQQAAWLEQEAQQEEYWANRLVYQVGKDRALAPEYHPPEGRRCRGRSQAEVAAVAAAEEQVVEAVVAAAVVEAHQRHHCHQEDKQWCKESQLQVRFQLPMGC